MQSERQLEAARRVKIIALPVSVRDAVVKHAVRLSDLAQKPTAKWVAGVQGKGFKVTDTNRRSMLKQLLLAPVP